jgi:hypothetical protein
MREQCIPISTERLLHRIKLAGMCMQDVTRATGTNMWTITKRCKTTVMTAQAIADVLYCKVADLMPPMEKDETQTQVITETMFLGPECHERAPCFARSGKGRCTILTSTYGCGEKACPFRKAHRKDRT